MTIPNKIVLIGKGRHEEGPSGTALYPGQLVKKDSSGNIIVHDVQGGPALVRVIKEDSLHAYTILQALVNGDTVPYHVAMPGDVLQMLLKNGQSVTAQDILMSAGDGTLIANPGQQLANIVAPSTTITNLGTETTFSNGSYAIPANTLQVGDRIRIRAKTFLIAENSTNTHRVRLYINATTLVDSTALQMAANDYNLFTIDLTVRTIGASGTFIATGSMTNTVSASATTTPVQVASTALDTTAAATLAIKSLASATSAGNQIRLDEFSVFLDRDYGIVPLVRAEETKDNSGGLGTSVGNAMFIRVSVL